MHQDAFYFCGNCRLLAGSYLNHPVVRLPCAILPAAPVDRRRAGGVLLLIAAAALWSLNGVGVKVLADVPTVGFALWRSLGAAIAAGCFVGLLRVRSKATGQRPAAGPLVVACGLYTANVTLVLLAMRENTAALGILLQYTGPAWVALLAWLLLKRRIGTRTALALGLAGAGVAVMLAGTRGTPLAIVYGLSSGLAYGGTILALDWVDRRAAGTPDVAAIVFWLNAAAVALLLPLSLVLGESGVGLGWRTLALVAAFGVVQLAIPYALFQLALPRVGPTDAALIVLLEPVLTPLWTWLAVGERPDAATFAGGALLLAALSVEATKRRGFGR